MNPSTTPSARDLIKELAAIEDRMYVVRAAGSRRSPGRPDPELLQLAAREEQVLALLRLQRATP